MATPHIVAAEEIAMQILYALLTPENIYDEDIATVTAIIEQALSKQRTQE